MSLVRQDRPQLNRGKGLVAAAAMSSLAAVMSPAAWADSTAAYCVLSNAKANSPLQQGACRWSQRQGNVTIQFNTKTYEFPSDQEGKTYTRLNRGGAEAGPVFTRKGQYTLSVYWRKPAADSPGF